MTTSGGTSPQRPRSAVAHRHLRAPGEGKLYLCAIKDVHSNRIVGYSIDSRKLLPSRPCTSRWTPEGGNRRPQNREKKLRSNTRPGADGAR